VTVTRTAHTAELSATELVGIRHMLVRAFTGEFDDTDWDHALGGLHVIITEGAHVAAHAAVVQRRLLYDGRALRAGYVEAVAVDQPRRGRGYAATVMNEAERIIRVAYDIGSLSAADGVARFYLSRGWLAWQGLTHVLSPKGITRTPDDDDSTFVLPTSSTSPMSVTGELACDWREGDVW
jgi:aminoglycoside 2'-N-acetyltransferase I